MDEQNPTIIDGLRDFYQNYDPSQIPTDNELQDLATKFHGNEINMWQQLYKHYETDSVTSTDLEHLLNKYPNPFSEKKNLGSNESDTGLENSSLETSPQNAPIAEDGTNVPSSPTPLVGDNPDFSNPTTIDLPGETNPENPTPIVEAGFDFKNPAPNAIPPRPPISNLEMIDSWLGSFNKGITNDFLANSLKGIGELQAMVSKPIDEDFEASDSWFYQAGSWIEKKSNEILYENEDVKNTIVSQVSRGLGQATGFIATGGASGIASKAPSAIRSTSSILSTTASELASAPAVLGMFQVVGSEADKARIEHQLANSLDKESYVLQKAQGGANSDLAGQTWDKLTSIEESELIPQILPAAIASGSTEFIPIAKSLKILDKSMGGVSQSFLNKLKDGTVNTIEGGLQEVIQEGLSNASAAQTYDFTREVTEGLKEAGEVGAGTQLALNIFMGALGAKRRQTNNINDIKEIEKAESLINEQKEINTEKFIEKIAGDKVDLGPSGSEVNLPQNDIDPAGALEKNKENLPQTTSETTKNDLKDEENSPQTDNIEKSIPENNDTSTENQVEVPENKEVEVPETREDKIPEKGDAIKRPKKRKKLADQLDAESLQDDIGMAFAEGVRITPESYAEIGDPNTSAGSGNIRLNYLKAKDKGGQNIDVFAKELSDKWGVDEKDAAQAIIDHINDQESTWDYMRRRIREQDSGYGNDPVFDNLSDEELAVLESEEGGAKAEAMQLEERSNVILDGATDEQIEEFNNFVDTYEDENGDVDWEKLAEDLEDPSFAIDFLGLDKDTYEKAIDFIEEKEGQSQASETDLESKGKKEEGAETKVLIEDLSKKEGIVTEGSFASDGAVGFVNDSTAGIKLGSGKVLEKINKAYRKYFTSKNGIPSKVFDLKIKKDSRINKVERQIESTVSKFKTVSKSDFGSKPDKTTIAQVDNALKGDQDAFNALSPDMQDVVSDMRNQIDTMSIALKSSGLIDGDLEVAIDENLGIYVTRAYQKHNDPEWLSKIEPDVWNKAAQVVETSLKNQIAFLESKPSVSEKQFDRLQKMKEQLGDIDGLLEYLVREDGESFSKESKLGQKDLSVLKKRTEITPEIRALYGEYTDPILNYANTLTKISRLLSNNQFLHEVEAIGKGVFLFDTPKKGFSTPLRSKTKDPYHTTSKTYDPLAKYNTSEDIAQAFADITDDPVVSEWLKSYLKINSTVKYSKTILSVSTHFRNVLGNGIFVLRNGHSLTEIAKSSKLLAQDFLKPGSLSVENEAYLQDAIGHGVLYDAPNSGELKALFKDVHNDDFAGLPSWGDTGMNKAEKAAKLGAKKIQEAYQKEDDMFKLAAWEVEKSRYAKALYKKPFKELNPSDQELVKQRAAEVVRTTYPTYTLVSRGVQQLRRFPLVGTFTSFPYEVVRTTFGTMDLIRKEMSDPRTRDMGIKRGLWFASSFAIPTILAMASKMLHGIGSEEEEAMRSNIPEWSKDSELMFWPMDDGRFTYIDIGQMDPNTYFKKPIYTMLFKQENESVGENIGSALHKIFEPFVSEEILVKAIDEVVNNKKRTGGPVYNPENSTMKIWEEASGHIFKAMQPGTVRSVTRIWNSHFDPEQGTSTTLKPAVEWAALFGIRVSTQNIERGYEFKAYKWAARKADAKRLFYSQYYKAPGKKKNETPEVYKSRVKELLRGAYDTSKSSYENIMKEAIYQTSQNAKLGMNNKQMMDMLLANRRFTKEEAAHIVAGKIPPFKIKMKKK